MDHCIIFFCSTGNPPRSDKPLITSSFANTVPNAGHQFTVLSLKKASLYFKSSVCFSVSENAFHSSALKVNTSSSDSALIPSEPEVSNFWIKVAIDSALSDSLLYHASKSCIKIHWVQR